MIDIKRTTGENRWLEIADLLSAVSKTLSRLSSQAGLVGVAHKSSPPIRRIRFVYVDDFVALAIVTTDGGEIRRHVIKTGEMITANTLEKMTNYFNDRFSHLTLPQIRRLLLKELQMEENRVNNMIITSLGVAEELERQSLDEDSEKIAIDGAANLISQAREQADLSAIQRIFEAIEEKSRLFSLISECLDGNGVSLVIGAEAEMEELNDFSVVSHPFSGTGGMSGAVGIIGRKQMDYGHNMALVTYAAREMSRRLSHEDSEN